MGYCIEEPAKQVPVWEEADVCVLGGSCTGLFAAVRAARLGMKVVLVEEQGRLGGTATSGLVNIWHKLLDDSGEKQIIGGLTAEVEERLEKKDRLKSEKGKKWEQAIFDPNYLVYVLDCLAKEEKIKLYLHTRYADCLAADQRIQAVFLENKDGRGAIRASFFLDCTGDGDMGRDIGLPSYRLPQMQPPSSCFLMKGHTNDEKISELVQTHGHEFGLDNDWGWYGEIPGIEDIYFRADNHVFGADCSKASDLTRAEIEGRRRAFALEELLNQYGKRQHRIVSLCSYIGIRDTCHYHTGFQASEKSLLLGQEYEDAILHGTYRLDVHHQEDNGITFKYLNGKVWTTYGKGGKEVVSNWREEMGLTGEPAEFYSLPFRALIQNQTANLIQAGRMVNADPYAFGALRVMVNTNQMGEAAGTAAALCVKSGLPVWEISGIQVRKTLNEGGSLL